MIPESKSREDFRGGKKQVSMVLARLDLPYLLVRSLVWGTAD
jgi:hypothetical protein